MSDLTQPQKEAIQVFIKLTQNYKGLDYLIPPLAKVSASMIRTVRESCHISKDLKMIFIRVKRIPANMEVEIKGKNPNYQFTTVIKGKRFLVFTPDMQFESDLKLLVEGRYTEMSPDAKATIFHLSGLKYNKKEGGIFQSDYLLQALLKDNPIKPILAAFIGEDVSSLATELIRKISDDSLVYIENWIEAS